MSSGSTYQSWYALNRDKVLAQRRERRMANKPARAAQDRKYYVEQRDNVLSRKRERQYGLSPEAFERMWNSQLGLCAICDTPLRHGKGGHAVDHDHMTGRVRALLCSKCNLLLGHAGNDGDDAAILARAIEYLGTHATKKEAA